VAYANRQVGYADEEFSDNAAAIITFLNPPVPQTVLPQDLMASSPLTTPPRFWPPSLAMWASARRANHF